jgi:hypothetical protein
VLAFLLASGCRGGRWIDRRRGGSLALTGREEAHDEERDKTAHSMGATNESGMHDLD